MGAHCVFYFRPLFFFPSFPFFPSFFFLFAAPAKSFPRSFTGGGSVPHLKGPGPFVEGGVHAPQTGDSTLLGNPACVNWGRAEGSAASVPYAGCWLKPTARPIQSGPVQQCRGDGGVGGEHGPCVASLSLSSLSASAQTSVPFYCSLLTRITHISSCAFCVNLSCHHLNSLPPPTPTFFFFSLLSTSL